MYEELKGKYALITGSAKGIGNEILKKFAEFGINVILHYNSSKDEAENTRKLISSHVNCLLIKADLTKEEEVKNMFQIINTEVSSLDILINNAGVHKNHYIISTPLSDWDEVVSVNLRGSFLCTKYASKIMMKKKTGNIINIISTITDRVINLQTAYTSSKFGLVGLTKSTAKELGKFNIRVNAISPGPINTNMNDFSMQDIEDIKHKTPLNTIADGHDIANTSLFLCSDCARVITGQIINVDGGLSL